MQSVQAERAERERGREGEREREKERERQGEMEKERGEKPRHADISLAHKRLKERCMEKLRLHTRERTKPGL